MAPRFTLDSRTKYKKRRLEVPARSVVSSAAFDTQRKSRVLHSSPSSPPPPSRPALQQVQNEFHGRRVRKWFRGVKRWYFGDVVGYDAQKGWWRVRYSDRDEEELNRREVSAYLLSETPTNSSSLNFRQCVDVRTWKRPDSKEIVIRVLNLFSGCQTVERAVRQAYSICDDFEIQVVSVDNDPEIRGTCGHVHTPSIVGDVLDWRRLLRKYQPGYFDIIWASPDCRYFSGCNNQTKTNVNVAEALQLVKETRACIDYYGPRVWFIENPWGGDLCEHKCMKDIECFKFKVSYCWYGTLYRKDTVIWTNCSGLRGKDGRSILRVCSDATPCVFLCSDFARHALIAQSGPDDFGMRRGCERTETYQVPPQLMVILIGKAVQNVVDLKWTWCPPCGH